jgi:hypothetical protein
MTGGGKNPAAFFFAPIFGPARANKVFAGAGLAPATRVTRHNPRQLIAVIFQAILISISNLKWLC